MKIPGRLSLKVLFFLGCGFSSLCAEESRVVLPRDYLNTVLNEIQSATATLTVVQYIFNLNLADKNSPTTQIARALVEAKNRGVRLEIILDQSADFSDETSKGDWILDKKNWEAYAYLRANGIPVFFDSPSLYTHSKIVIRDGRSTLLGSTNWSNKSLNENLESNVLIQNTLVAEQFLRWVMAIERQTLPQHNSPAVSIPTLFIENPNYLSALVKRDDKSGFDLTLHLLKLARENGSRDFNLDYENAVSALNLKGKDRSVFRSQITRVLHRLERKYGLLHFEKKFGRDSRIHLNENLFAKSASPAPPSVNIPLDFWNFGWDKKLSLSAKVFYLLSLHYASLSPSNPEWSMTVKQLAWSLHVSKDFIQNWSQELKKENLLSIQYDVLEYRVTEPRKPNVYALKPLYDPAVLQKGLLHLEMEHGKEQFARAVKCAELVFAQNDFNAVKEFIRLENEYGKEKVAEAYRIIQLKNVDNPKRSVGYFFNTIKGIKAVPSHAPS